MRSECSLKAGRGLNHTTDSIQQFTLVLLGNNAHRMVTNQLAIKRFVRANLIPKLHRLSSQTFWGLLPFKVFPAHLSFEQNPQVSNR